VPFVPFSLRFLNAAATWHGKLQTGGCDEGCNAYIFAELQDAATGSVAPGYSRHEFQTIMDADSADLPMVWGKPPPGNRTSGSSEGVVAVDFSKEAGAVDRKEAGAVDLSKEAGVVTRPKQMRLRIFFRDAMVYSMRVEGA
jgi:hypothetical protein